MTTTQGAQMPQYRGSMQAEIDLLVIECLVELAQQEAAERDAYQVAVNFAVVTDCAGR